MTTESNVLYTALSGTSDALTENYTNAADYATARQAWLLANGYSEEDASNIGNALSNSSIIQALFNGDTAEALADIVADSGLEWGGALLKEQAAATVGKIADLIENGQSMGVAGAVVFSDIGAPPTVTAGLVKALAIEAAAFTGAYATMEIAAAEDPGTEAFKQAVLFEAGAI